MVSISTDESYMQKLLWLTHTTAPWADERHGNPPPR